MKSIYCTCVGALLLSSSLIQVAVAADMPVETPLEYLADPAFDWTGFYAGLHGGYLWGDADAERDTISAGTFGKTYDLSGGFLGAHAGYLHQFQNNFVAGFEGDVDYNWADGEMEQTSQSMFNPFPDATGDAELKWASSLRARLGYAFDRTLPYLTAGVAFGRLEFAERPQGNTDTFYAQNDSRTLTGLTVGGGVSHAFTNRLIGHFEYRFTDYGSETFLPTPVGGQSGDSSSIDLQTHAVRVGLSLKLN